MGFRSIGVWTMQRPIRAMIKRTVIQSQKIWFGLSIPTWLTGYIFVLGCVADVGCKQTTVSPRLHNLWFLPWLSKLYNELPCLWWLCHLSNAITDNLICENIEPLSVIHTRGIKWLVIISSHLDLQNGKAIIVFGISKLCIVFLFWPPLSKIWSNHFVGFSYIY